MGTLLGGFMNWVDRCGLDPELHLVPGPICSSSTGISSVRTLQFPSIQSQQGPYASDLGLFRSNILLIPTLECFSTKQCLNIPCGFSFWASKGSRNILKRFIRDHSFNKSLLIPDLMFDFQHHKLILIGTWPKVDILSSKSLRNKLK